MTTVPAGSAQAESRRIALSVTLHIALRNMGLRQSRTCSTRAQRDGWADPHRFGRTSFRREWATPHCLLPVTDRFGDLFSGFAIMGQHRGILRQGNAAFLSPMAVGGFRLYRYCARRWVSW